MNIAWRDVAWAIQKRGWCPEATHFAGCFPAGMAAEDAWDAHNDPRTLLFFACHLGVPVASLVRAALSAVQETTSQHFACARVDGARDAVAGFCRGAVGLDVVSRAGVELVDAYFGNENWPHPKDPVAIHYVRAFLGLCEAARREMEPQYVAGDLCWALTVANRYVAERAPEDLCAAKRHAARMAAVVRREVPWALVEEAMHSTVQRTAQHPTGSGETP